MYSITVHVCPYGSLGCPRYSVCPYSRYGLSAVRYCHTVRHPSDSRSHKIPRAPQSPLGTRILLRHFPYCPVDIPRIPVTRSVRVSCTGDRIRLLVMVFYRQYIDPRLVGIHISAVASVRSIPQVPSVFPWHAPLEYPVPGTGLVCRIRLFHLSVVRTSLSDHL